MIIHSLLDTDLYKFTMMQVVLHHFPGARVEYRFKCRNPGVNLAQFAGQIRDEVRSLCSLQFRDAELAYLRSMRFIKSDFVDFLGLFRLNEKYINIIPQPSGELEIRIKGPWLHTILFEIPVLAIVNEVYFRNTQKKPDLEEGRRRLETKISQLQDEGLTDLKIADYGTRRRFSKDWHEEVLRTLTGRLGAVTSPAAQSAPGARLPQLAGTSNVLYAMKLGLIPLGTMAHEYLQACQALGPRLRDSQIFGFESWAREYRGDLGIALSDVYGMNAFLRDFDLYFCKLFDNHESHPWTFNCEYYQPWTRNRVLKAEQQSFSKVEGGAAVVWATRRVVHAFKAGGKASPPLGGHPRTGRGARSVIHATWPRRERPNRHCSIGAAFKSAAASNGAGNV